MPGNNERNCEKEAKGLIRKSVIKVVFAISKGTTSNMQKTETKVFRNDFIFDFIDSVSSNITITIKA